MTSNKRKSYDFNKVSNPLNFSLIINNDISVLDPLNKNSPKKKITKSKTVKQINPIRKKSFYLNDGETVGNNITDKILIGSNLKREETGLQSLLKSMIKQMESRIEPEDDEEYLFDGDKQDNSSSEEEINYADENKKLSESKIIKRSNELQKHIIYENTTTANERPSGDLNKLQTSSGKLRRKLRRVKKVYDSLSEDEDSTGVFDKSNPGVANLYFKANIFIINPNGKFKSWWNYIIFLLILYCVFVSSYKISFSTIPYKYNDSFNYDFFIDVAIDTFFFLDFIMNFFMAYYDSEENLIVARKLIILHYLKGFFLIDALTSIPVSYINFIIYFSKLKSSSFSKFYIIIKWARVLRIIKLLYNDSYKDNFVYRLFFSEKNSSVALRLGTIFIIITHLTTCLWCYFGNIGDMYNDSWIDAAFLLDDTHFNIYIASMYYTLATIFTIGYGDITPRNQGERIYIIFFCFVGIFVFSFAVSWLSAKFGFYDKKTIKLNKKLKILNDITQDFKIPQKLTAKIKNYIELQHSNDHIERYKFIESLPINLKNQVIFVIYQNQMKKLKFFQDVNYDFLLFVVPLILSVKLIKNDILFSHGGFVEEMYMVSKGVLSLSLGKLYHYLEVAQIRENQHFGEILMFSNEQISFDLKVKTTRCLLYIIRKNDFSKIKMKFPEIVLGILKKSYKSYCLILKRRKFFIELISNLPNDIEKDEFKTYYRKTQKSSSKKFDYSDNGIFYHSDNRQFQSNTSLSKPNLNNKGEIINQTHSVQKSNSAKSIVENKDYINIDNACDEITRILNKNVIKNRADSNPVSPVSPFSYDTLAKTKSNKESNSSLLYPDVDEEEEEKNIIINITNIENNISNHFHMFDKFSKSQSKNLERQIQPYLHQQNSDIFLKRKSQQSSIKKNSASSSLEMSNKIDKKSSFKSDSGIRKRYSIQYNPVKFSLGKRNNSIRLSNPASPNKFFINLQNNKIEEKGNSDSNSSANIESQVEANTLKSNKELQKLDKIIEKINKLNNL